MNTQKISSSVKKMLSTIQLNYITVKTLYDDALERVDNIDNIFLQKNKCIDKYDRTIITKSFNSYRMPDSDNEAFLENRKQVLKGTSLQIKDKDIRPEYKYYKALKICEEQLLKFQKEHIIKNSINDEDWLKMINRYNMREKLIALCTKKLR